MTRVSPHARWDVSVIEAAFMVPLSAVVTGYGTILPSSGKQQEQYTLITSVIFVSQETFLFLAGKWQKTLSSRPLPAFEKDLDRYTKL